MFRALTCPSSGGKIVFTQYLVSSLSVNGCTVHRLRADSALNWCTVQPFTESDNHWMYQYYGLYLVWWGLNEPKHVAEFLIVNIDYQYMLCHWRNKFIAISNYLSYLPYLLQRGISFLRTFDNPDVKKTIWTQETGSSRTIRVSNGITRRTTPNYYCSN